MAPTETSDLERAIDVARRPLVRPAMPPAPLRIRLKTSTALRRLLPRRLVLRRAVRKGRARWENLGERQRALATMEVILAGTARGGEVQQLARRRLIEQAAQDALYWQPWRTVSVDDSSRERLDRTLASGRRLLVSVCHLGPFFLQVSALTSRGISTIAVSAPWFFEKPSHDYWGRRLARWWQGICARDERLLHSVGCFPVAKSLLEAGEVVLVYFDMPGTTTTTFLGKPVMLSSGSAQLAFQTDALILPLRARREGARVFTDVREPLDPRDFTSAQELHQALAGDHERSILELAETLEDPCRAGAWERGATAEEWSRPQHRGMALSASAE